jgi:6-phosphogluconolactonase
MNHRPAARVAGLFVLSVLSILAAAAAAQGVSAEGRLRVYLGTYTGTGSQGIYRAELDTATGALGQPVLAAEAANPSFLVVHPRRPLLYCVGEVGGFQGRPGGAVSAFAIDPATGGLSLIGQQSSRGDGPCHLAVDRSGRCVLVANYGGGSIACLPILEDGRLGPAGSVVQHHGSSVDRGRQEGPHAHGIYVDLDNRFVFVPDLGLDKVMIYVLDPARAKVSPAESAFAAVAPGSGPRHFAFHPSGRYAFVINEMGSTLTSFVYDPQRGALETIETVSSLPEGFKGDNTTAEVVVHPSGKFVYGSNRGHDSIVAFAFDAGSGRLRLVGHEPTQGRSPRNFNIDPSGTWLLAANQDGDNVVVLRIDPDSGKLTATGHSIRLSKPVCVEFVKRL